MCTIKNIKALSLCKGAFSDNVFLNRLFDNFRFILIYSV